MPHGRLFFGLMYRFGFTPWDGHPLPPKLVELVEGDQHLTPSRALDIGCGTGDTSIYLAKHDWNVTGVDFVEAALRRARAKATAARVSPYFVRADVTRLRETGIDGTFEFLVDSGCLHCLSDEARAAYVPEVTAVAAPGARLLLMGFAETSGRGARGFDQPEVERRFADGWSLLGTGIAAETSTRDGDPLHYYELRRT